MSCSTRAKTLASTFPRSHASPSAAAAAAVCTPPPPRSAPSPCARVPQPSPAMPNRAASCTLEVGKRKVEASSLVRSCPARVCKLLLLSKLLILCLCSLLSVGAVRVGAWHLTVHDTLRTPLSRIPHESRVCASSLRGPADPAPRRHARAARYSVTLSRHSWEEGVEASELPSPTLSPRATRPFGSRCPRPAGWVPPRAPGRSFRSRRARCSRARTRRRRALLSR